VDFAAPHGTPIPAGGAGTVVARGFEANGYGNYIKIRHNSTYTTLYAHMSSFARGMTVGTRVNQGQTIGFVGSTGISTGPHLHYEIHRNGIAVNPLTINLPSSITLPKEEETRFAEARDRLSLQFAALDRTFSPLASFMAK
jgi:murein DD-endopeptidase MepM/ murein hydrolase activator NlpD